MTTLTLANLIDDYLKDLWQRDPVQATKVGVHTHDDQLPNFDPDALEAGYNKDRRLRSDLRSVAPESLSENERLDRQVALANLERSIAEHETLKPWQRDPGLYVRAVIQGVYSLIEREHAPFEERTRSLLSRLRKAPAMLRQGHDNLTGQVPKVFADTALQQIRGAIRFLETAVPQLSEKAPKLQGELAETNQATLTALTEYAQLVGRLAEQRRGQFAVGKDYYDFLLRDYHLLNLDSDELLDLGQRSIPQAQAELATMARQIDPNRNWIEITTELKRDHPPNEGLLDMYQQEVDLAKAFVLEKDLVTVPQDEGFWATWTPPFMWATIPYGFTCSPRPFEKDNKGFWQITPADPDTPPEMQEQKLQGHNRWNARAIALHEGYPGHHMHFCLVKLLPSKIRRQFWDTVFVEGWGLYTEELMWEAGYFDDLRVRLIQLVNALWRAVRVVVDVGLHTRDMPLQESIDMLVDVSRLERINATGETARYAAMPIQAASYLLGKTMIMELRDAYKTKMGSAFNLKAFHDRLLSYGAISPVLVRECMLRG